MRLSLLSLVVAAIISGPLCSGSARAQSYPSKPIKACFVYNGAQLLTVLDELPVEPGENVFVLEHHATGGAFVRIEPGRHAPGGYRSELESRRD